MAFVCDMCAEIFTAKCSLTRHIEGVHKNGKFACKKCGMRFAKINKLFLHEKCEKGQVQCTLFIKRGGAIMMTSSISASVASGVMVGKENVAAAGSSVSSGGSTVAIGDASDSMIIDDDDDKVAPDVTRGVGEVKDCYIPLPHSIMLKRACVNLHHKDNYCFKWAVIAAIANVNNAHTCISYRIPAIAADVIEVEGISINFSGLTFPVDIKEIEIFDKNNTHISINVFGYDSEANMIEGPYYCSESEKNTHLNLLLLQKEENFHYASIKNLSR